MYIYSSNPWESNHRDGNIGHKNIHTLYTCTYGPTCTCTYIKIYIYTCTVEDIKKLTFRNRSTIVL